MSGCLFIHFTAARAWRIAGLIKIPSREIRTYQEKKSLEYPSTLTKWNCLKKSCPYLRFSLPLRRESMPKTLLKRDGLLWYLLAAINEPPNILFVSRYEMGWYMYCPISWLPTCSLQNSLFKIFWFDFVNAFLALRAFVHCSHPATNESGSY